MVILTSVALACLMTLCTALLHRHADIMAGLAGDLNVPRQIHHIKSATKLRLVTQLIDDLWQRYISKFVKVVIFWIHGPNRSYSADTNSRDIFEIRSNSSPRLSGRIRVVCALKLTMEICVTRGTQTIMNIRAMRKTLPVPGPAGF